MSIFHISLSLYIISILPRMCSFHLLDFYESLTHSPRSSSKVMTSTQPCPALPVNSFLGRILPFHRRECKVNELVFFTHCYFSGIQSQGLTDGRQSINTGNKLIKNTFLGDRRELNREGYICNYIYIYICKDMYVGYICILQQDIYVL